MNHPFSPIWMAAWAGIPSSEPPTARDKLRRVLILDQPDRDEIASKLLRYGDANGDGWAGVIDTLTMYPDVRRQAVRLLVEIDASM